MPPVFCALILVYEVTWEQQRIFSGKKGAYKLLYVLFTETLMKRLSPFHRWENQMSEKGKTEIHTEVDLGWSLILRSMTGGHPPLLSYLKNPQTQIIIRKSCSSVCRKSCLSTFSSYPSVPKQMGKGSSTLLVSGVALLLHGIIVI